MRRIANLYAGIISGPHVSTYTSRVSKYKIRIAAPYPAYSAHWDIATYSVHNDSKHFRAAIKTWLRTKGVWSMQCIPCCSGPTGATACTPCDECVRTVAPTHGHPCGCGRAWNAHGVFPRGRGVGR